MLGSILIGAAIGAILGCVIAEICLYIDGYITAYRVREEAKRQEALNAVQKFLVAQVEHTTTGPKIHIDGKDTSGNVIAHLTVEGGSSTNLSKYDTFFR